MGTSSADRDTKETVAAVWCEILETETIDPDADFFAIGGDSRAAARIITQLRKELDLQELPLILIFECPTISSLAGAIDDLRKEQAASTA
jgi:L-serine---[L-seryl-carrier protein] ligase